jgi:hypothetical protein
MGTQLITVVIVHNVIHKYSTIHKNNFDSSFKEQDTTRSQFNVGGIKNHISR